MNDTATKRVRWHDDHHGAQRAYVAEATVYVEPINSATSAHLASVHTSRWICKCAWPNERTAKRQAAKLARALAARGRTTKGARR